MIRMISVPEIRLRGSRPENRMNPPGTQTGEIRSFTVHLRRFEVHPANREKLRINSGQKPVVGVMNIDGKWWGKGAIVFRCGRWPVRLLPKEARFRLK
jgi:hypothetical protein